MPITLQNFYKAEKPFQDLIKVRKGYAKFYKIEDNEGTSHECVDIKLTTCLMYSTSLRHNIEVRVPRVEQYYLSFHEIHVLKSR